MFEAYQVAVRVFGFEGAHRGCDDVLGDLADLATAAFDFRVRLWIQVAVAITVGIFWGRPFRLVRFPHLAQFQCGRIPRVHGLDGGTVFRAVRLLVAGFRCCDALVVGLLAADDHGVGLIQAFDLHG